MLTRIFLVLVASLVPIFNSYGSSRENLCLNGDLWERAFNGGSTPPVSGWESIRVPEGWGQRYNFDFGQKPESSQQHSAWYRTTFMIPADWQGQRVILRLERIHEKGDLRINGKAIGSHTGWAVPWTVDITDAALPGKVNLLELRVESHKNRFDVGWDNSLLWAGIEGNVYLDKIAPVHVDDIRIVTSVRQKQLSTQLALVNNSGAAHNLTVVQEVFLRGKSVLKLNEQSVLLAANAVQPVKFEQPWSDPVLWGFEPFGKPELYYLVTTVKENGRELDRQATRFGFREFWIQKTKFYFNGKEFFLKGDGLNFAGPALFYNRSYLTAYFIASRDANVNTIRPHVGEMFPPPIVFEVADELGMLIIPQASVADILKPGDVSWFTSTFQGYMRAHYNHPSIIMWGIDNESNMQSDTNPTIEVWKIMKQFGDDAKKVDTSRPLLFAGDLKLGLAPRYGIPSPLEIYSIHPYGDPIYNEVMRLCMLYGYKGNMPILLDEIYSGEHEPFSDKTTSEQYLKNRFVYYKAYDALGDFWYRAIIDGHKKAKISGAIPWCLSECIYYGPASEKEMNLTPWVNSKVKGESVAMVKGGVTVLYPALSGPDMKVPYYGLNRMFGRCFNYFDSTLPIYRKNVTFDYVRKAFAEVDGLPPGPLASQRMADVVVAAFDNNGKALSGKIVKLIPRGGQLGGIQGVVADRQGKAWFVVKEEGAYDVIAEGQKQTLKIDVAFPPLTHEAGFKHVQWVVVGKGSVEADKKRLASPAPVERSMFMSGDTAIKMPKEDVRQGPFALDADGFIRDWLLCGPFPNTGNRQDGFVGYRTDYLAGQKGELGIEPKRGMSHPVVFPESKFWKAGKTNGVWRQYHSRTSLVDLSGLINPEVELTAVPPQFVVAYAACYVSSPTARQVLLATGSDDGYKAWFNHQAVGGDPTHGEALKDARLQPVDLHKGRNVLLLKVDQSFNGWGFYCRFLDTKTKTPIKDLKILLE